MIQYPKRQALLRLSFFIFVFCSLSKFIHAADNYLPINEFAKTYSLTVTSEPGAARVTLTGTFGKIVFSPGMNYIAINGRSVRLSYKPKAIGGQMQIPTELTRYIKRVRTTGGPINGTVILDPGHGGKDSGAVCNGLQEKDVVLDVALRAKQKLQDRGATVIMTRSTDKFISLGERSRIANRYPKAILVSIHADALSRSNRKWRSVYGVETFVLCQKISENYRVNKAVAKYDLQKQTSTGIQAMSSREKKSAIAKMSKTSRHNALSLAQLVQQYLVNRLGEKDRKVKPKNLAVLRETYFCPAILTEIGFLTHAPTAQKMKTAAYRDRIAQALADAIGDYFNQ